MSNNKRNHACIVIYIILSFTNILVCINILSFDALALGAVVGSITSLYNTVRKKGIIRVAHLIWIITTLAGFMKIKFLYG